MSLSRASILEFDGLDLQIPDQRVKFIRMSKRLMTPERIHIRGVYRRRMRVLD